MLKKSASGVPCLAEAHRAGWSPRSAAQRTEAYASPLRSLRPCWTAFLSILTVFCRSYRTEHSSHIVGIN